MFYMFNSHVTFYTSYLGFNYVNTIGFILICLYVIQLVSGLQLSLYYNYSLGYYAFDSIQFIMKDVNIGYLISISHIVGSSFYMLFLWLHLLRGLFINLFFYSFISSFVGAPTRASLVSFVHFQASQRINIILGWILVTAPNFVVNALSRLPVFDSSFFLLNIFQSLGFGFQLVIYFFYRFYSRLINLFLIPYSSFLSFYSSSLENAPLSRLLVSRISSLASCFDVHFIFVSFVNSFYFTFYYVYFIGLLIFLISIAVSFIGYTLVFGNLSYYGVIVILGIVSSLPSLLLYFIQFLFLFFSFLFILSIIAFLFLFSSN